MTLIYNSIFLVAFCAALFAQSAEEPAFSIARLKYDGGGDWYNDRSAEINLLRFVERETGMTTDARHQFVELSSEEIFAHPFLFMTGHGNVVFSERDAERLRAYLEGGGFLYVDDDYGLDKPFRREMKKVFPDRDLLEVPYNHPIYRIRYDFSSGPPKTHKHDEKAPRGYGLFVGERMAVFYTVESNPSDGWADPEVHNDPEATRLEALRFGANIVLYSATQ